MSGALAVANPRRIKAAHRRRRKVAVGPIVQRYYDPGIGRFLSRDPVAANASTGANFNRYWYANNNPYRFTDPDGRAPLDKERKDFERIDRRSMTAHPSLAGSVRTVGGGAISSSGKAGSSASSSTAKTGPAQSEQGKGWSGTSVFTGDKKVTFTGVAALGSGIKAEKVTGPENDKVSFVTPALGLSASGTVNLGTVRYDWGGQSSAFDAGVSGGGIRGGLGLAGGLQLNVDSQGIELQVSGGVGAGVSADLYGIGYRPGADR